ncbi:MAG: protein BatD [Paludibacteraceae bacterium]|nr:protein BatD [Paludibacteraceae bacterium]
MKRITYIFLFLCIVLGAFADDVSFRASAPSQVVVGTPFQLTYTVNQRAKDLRAPEFEGFDVLAGPYTSQSSSTQFINGTRTSTFTLTYTYTLMAQNVGTFTLPPATITVSHNTYNSNGLKITVLPEDEKPDTQQQGSAGGNSQAGRTSQASGSKDDLFIRTIVSKTNVYEQECITLSYKLYTLVDVAQFTNNTKIPEFMGFVKQEVDLGNIQTNLEHYNGRNYQTATLFETQLYPQKSGDIKIEPASFEAIVRVRNQSQVRSIFDDFFDTYSNVSRQLVAPGVTIHVKSLPSGRPQGFSAGVGSFTMNSSISATELSTNEAVTLKITVSGTGNMKMLKTPQVEWPEGFETYDPKLTNNTRNSAGGLTGSKTFEYLAIPRASGTYTIPAVSYSYFDPQAGAYKTLSTPPYTLQIKKGADDNNAVVSNYVNKEDIRQLGSDIRHIYTGEIKQSSQDKVKFGSWIFWMLYIIPLLLTIIIIVVLRKRIRDNADIRKVKYRKANKEAQRRLRQAKKMMTEQNEKGFYEEIERALWNYLSDKLSIPTAELTKDNISQLLLERGIDQNTIDELNTLLRNAEFARYAPSQNNTTMQQMYEQTAELINKIN